MDYGCAKVLRRGTRFTYEYDLNIPWRHEIRIEETQPDTKQAKALPRCIAGDGACPPEDCGCPESFMTACDGRFLLDALEDLDTMMEIFQRVVAGDGSDILSDVLDQETRLRLEEALGRAKRLRDNRFCSARSTPGPGRASTWTSCTSSIDLFGTAPGQQIGRQQRGIVAMLLPDTGHQRVGGRVGQLVEAALQRGRRRLGIKAGRADALVAKEAL